MNTCVYADQAHQICSIPLMERTRPECNACSFRDDKTATATAKPIQTVPTESNSNQCKGSDCKMTGVLNNQLNSAYSEISALKLELQKAYAELTKLAGAQKFLAAQKQHKKRTRNVQILINDRELVYAMKKAKKSNRKIARMYDIDEITVRRFLNGEIS